MTARRAILIFLLGTSFGLWLCGGHPVMSSSGNNFLASLFDARAEGADFPAPTGFVNDFAGVIPPETIARIEGVSIELEQKTGVEIVVATVKTIGGADIQQYSVDLFTKWGIGKKGKDNGLLIVAAIDDRKLWVKTGYGLEGTIPDAVASQVYRDVLLPAFRSGDYGRGILTAVNILAWTISKSEGVTLASVDSLSVPRPGRLRQRNKSPLATLIPIIFIVVLLIVMRSGGGPGSRRTGGFPFWALGGFAGGMRGGGFGGGFGGFGGGSAGGGGAGGGW